MKHQDLKTGRYDWLVLLPQVPVWLGSLLPLILSLFTIFDILFIIDFFALILIFKSIASRYDLS